MIWSAPFSDRLRAWHQLRDVCKNAELPTALIEINRWWHRAPWAPYWLHWDDQKIWPDPWQLLSNPYLCPVARALGIVYTIILMDRSDLVDAVMIEADSDNLVLVCDKKYILNWDAEQIVNIDLGEIIPRRQIRQDQIAALLL